MRRTAEDAARTRVALLEAALMSFEEKGWRGATFEHVAERAGVTRGALHHHFRDKQALLIAALEWGWSDYEQRLFAGIDDESESGAREKIEALLSHFVRLLTGDPRFRALASTTVLVAPHAAGRSEKNDALDGWRGRIEDVIAASGEAGHLAPRGVAGLVLVLLQGFTVTAVIRPQDLPQPDELDAFVKALVRGFLHS